MSSKPGEKELAARALREKRYAGKSVTAPEPKRTKQTEPKAPDGPAPNTEEIPVAKKTTAKKAKRPAKAKAPKTSKASAKPRTTRVPKEPKPEGETKERTIRPGSKLEIVVNLLRQPGGCTTAEVIAATGWPSVSMPQQAKSAGLTLKKEKIEGVTRYSAE